MSLNAFEQQQWAEIVSLYGPLADPFERAVEKAASDFRVENAVSLLVDSDEVLATKEVAVSLNSNTQEFTFDKHDRNYYDDGTEILAQVADEYMLSPEAMKKVLKLAEGKVA